MFETTQDDPERTPHVPKATMDGIAVAFPESDHDAPSQSHLSALQRTQEPGRWMTRLDFQTMHHDRGRTRRWQTPMVNSSASPKDSR
jgi:hypothetical protein